MICRLEQYRALEYVMISSIKQFGSGKAYVPLFIEPLDTRLYFSAAVVGYNLRIEGTDADNVIRVVQSIDHFTVRQDGKTQTFPRTGIKQIVVYGNNGDDKIDLRGNSPRTLVHGDEGDDT